MKIRDDILSNTVVSCDVIAVVYIVASLTRHVMMYRNHWRTRCLLVLFLLL